MPVNILKTNISAVEASAPALEHRLRALRTGGICVGMVKSSKPPRFGVKMPSSVKPAIQPKVRTSPRERGYDGRWDRLSINFRNKNPWCLFCEQIGRDGLAEVVDHALPVQDFPDLRYEWSNLVPLCKLHHDGLKQRMEQYARKTGQLRMLCTWCRDPSSRPDRFKLMMGPQQK